MTDTIGHEELMSLALVRDADRNVWAQQLEPALPFLKTILKQTTTPVVAAECVNPRYLNLLAGAAVLYHMNQHAAEMLEQHVATLEAAGRDDLAKAFIDMAGNLNTARRIALEGLDTHS